MFRDRPWTIEKTRETEHHSCKGTAAAKCRVVLRQLSYKHTLQPSRLLPPPPFLPSPFLSKALVFRDLFVKRIPARASVYFILPRSLPSSNPRKRRKRYIIVRSRAFASAIASHANSILFNSRLCRGEKNMRLRRSILVPRCVAPAFRFDVIFCAP